MTYDHTTEQEGWAIFRVGQGVLIEDGKVLLSGNRWYTGKPLMWTLPGGRTDEGEGVAEAAVREFREETGLDVEVLDLAFVAEARSTARKRLFLTCAFTVRWISGQLTCEGDEAVEEVGFVPFAELDAYLPNPSIGDPLRWYLAHRGESARYWFFPEYEAG